MNLKIEITKYVLNHLGMEINDKNLKKCIAIFWKNIRDKSSGGLQLTPAGFKALKGAGIKDYRVQLENPVVYTNQLIIWLDQFISCPWYVDQKDIYVFDEKFAIQLVLFSGNIARFSAAKARQPMNSVT
jgi:hypothetical protein